MKIKSLHETIASVENEDTTSTRLCNRTKKYIMDSSNGDERTRSHLDTSCPQEAERRATYKKLDSINESIERRSDVLIVELLKIYSNDTESIPMRMTFVSLRGSTEGNRSLSIMRSFILAMTSGWLVQSSRKDGFGFTRRGRV